MVQVGRLPRPERLLLAEVSGVAKRYGTGKRRDAPRDEAVQAVQAVTRDPVLLGIAAGTAAADPNGVSGPVLELLHQAGADMTIAAAHEAEVRGRITGLGIRYHQPPA